LSPLHSCGAQRVIVGNGVSRQSRRRRITLQNKGPHQASSENPFSHYETPVNKKITSSLSIDSEQVLMTVNASAIRFSLPSGLLHCHITGEHNYSATRLDGDN
jgi:hypothetical protein